MTLKVYWSYIFVDYILSDVLRDKMGDPRRRHPQRVTSLVRSVT